MKRGKVNNFIFRNRQTILIFVLTLIILVLILVILVTKAPIISQATKGIFNVVSVLLGGSLGGALAAIFYSNYRTSREYKSLILAFASELILAFERCVLYYKQSLHLPPIISYSVLFDFTDASVLSKLATVTKDLTIIEAIMHLKAQYFQVGRQVEEATKYTAQAERFPQEANELKRLAHRAQLTALAFFLGSDLPRPDPETYTTIVEKTSLILNEAERVSPRKIAEELSSRFATASKLKRQIEDTRKLLEDKKINASDYNNKLDAL